MIGSVFVVRMIWFHKLVWHTADVAAVKADIARDFQMLYRHLWLMGVGIIEAIVALTRMLA